MIKEVIKYWYIGYCTGAVLVLDMILRISLGMNCSKWYLVAPLRAHNTIECNECAFKLFTIFGMVSYIHAERSKT